MVGVWARSRDVKGISWFLGLCRTLKIASRTLSDVVINSRGSSLVCLFVCCSDSILMLGCLPNSPLSTKKKSQTSILYIKSKNNVLEGGRRKHLATYRTHTCGTNTVWSMLPQIGRPEAPSWLLGCGNFIKLWRSSRALCAKWYTESSFKGLFGCLVAGISSHSGDHHAHSGVAMFLCCFINCRTLKIVCSGEVLTQSQCWMLAKLAKKSNIYFVHQINNNVQEGGRPPTPL